MTDLVDFVTEKHGGAQRWADVKRVNADVHVFGPFWAYKGQPDLLGHQNFQLDVAAGTITMSPFGAGRTLTLDAATGGLQVTDTASGGVEVVSSPRSTMTAYDGADPWTAEETGYFISYATMMYMLEPVIFTLPGVQTREIEPWSEDGETWRRLEVDFPSTIPTHNPRQVYYFDSATGLQRRMDYVVEVNGQSDVAHYTSEHREFDGLIIPTRRRVLPRKPDNFGDHSFGGILLDVSSVSFEF